MSSVFHDMQKAIQSDIDAEKSNLDGAKDWNDFASRVNKIKGMKQALARVSEHMKISNNGDPNEQE